MDALKTLIAAGMATEWQRQGDWAQISCPFAPWRHRDCSDAHPSFGFNLRLGYGYCFSCGEHVASLWQLLTFIGTLTHSRKLLDLADTCLEDTGDAVQLAFERGKHQLETLRAEEDNLKALETWFLSLESGSDLLAYLRFRGFENAEALQAAFDLRWDPEEKRVLIPVYSPGGVFVGTQGRATDAREPKTKHYLGTRSTRSFGAALGAFSGNIEAVVLVEGPFDMYRIWSDHTKYTPLCVFGCGLSDDQCQILEQLYRPVVLMFDNDDAGRRGQQKAARMLQGGVPEVKILSLTTVKDPGELRPGEFSALVAQGVKS